MEVHQLIPCLVPGDAMGQAAVAWQKALRHLGYSGRLYAQEIAKGLESLAQPARRLAPAPDDLVLYHHGIASELAGRVMHLPCKRGVVFHNVTPARFYRGSRLAEPLVSGRAQLAALASFCDVSLGVSRFNARELEVAGHRNVHVVPLSVEPQRFLRAEADLPLLKSLEAGGRPLVVSVSRVVPHKRMEDLLSLHAELLRIAPKARLVIIGGLAKGHPEVKALEARAAALGHVTFLGRVSHSELVAAYRAADVFVSMSEHEGFGVPLVEAMAAELPVLAYGAAAVPETMGGRGIVFDEKHFAGLAELVKLVASDEKLRARLVKGQKERLSDFSVEATTAALGEALKPLEARAPAPRRRSTRPRVAFVVQRYGEDITGGAEAHARSVARRLSAKASVEVLTTCATDHLSWANELPPGTSRDGRVVVHRFPVERPRAMKAFNRLSDRVLGRPQDLMTEEQWLAAQGPIAPGLFRALSTRRDEWDAVVLFTYLYAPAQRGVPLVANKALVVPTAHDEPPLAFHSFADVFEKPRALLCNTPEEEALIRSRFPNAARSRIVGVGIEPEQGDAERFKKVFGLRGSYLLYLGRLEAGKGVPELVRYHQRLVKDFHDAPTLVLAGAGELLPTGEKIRTVGRLDESQKWDALSGALAVCVPSRYESLSLVTLEAFAVGTPVLGNAACEVVVGQLRRSKAGVAFHDAESFAEAVRAVGEERARLSKSGRAYAKRFGWDAIIEAYLEEIDRVRTTA